MADFFDIMIKDIVERAKTTPLTEGEIDFLYEHKYVFDSSTPDNIRRNVTLSLRSYQLDENSFDITTLDFQSSEVRGALSSYNRDRYELYQKMTYSGMDIRELPNYDLHVEVRKREYSFLLAEGIGKIDKEREPGSLIYQSYEYELLSQSGKDFIVDYALKKGAPVYSFPDVAFQDVTMLRRFQWTERGCIDESVIQILSSDKYSVELEQAFVRQYGVKDIEGFIRTNAMQGKNLSGIPIEVRLASQKLFIAKELDRHGVEDVSVHVNSDFLGEGVRGAYTDDLRKISIPAKQSQCDATATTYYVGAHEAEHANQFLNIRNMDFNKDPDVDLYTKDRYLRSRLGNEYYNENYWTVSTEFDADMNAQITMNNIEHGSPDNLYSILRAKIASRVVKKEKVLDQISRKMAYSYSRTRIAPSGELVHLDDLVGQQLDEHMRGSSSFEEFRADIEEHFPLLGLEYELSLDGVRKKGPSELVAGMDQASSEKEYDAYGGLIASSMDVRKCKDAEQNVEKFRDIASHPSTPGDIRKSINGSMSRATEQNKYISQIGPNVDVGKTYGV